MDADWWKALDRLDESLKRSHEAARRREEVRLREEAAAAYERHMAEYEQYMAAYERYEAKAAAAAERLAAEAERDAEALSEAECAMTVKEEDEPAMVIDDELPEIVPATVLDGILSPIDTVLPQIDDVLLQTRESRFFLPQIHKFVHSQIGKLGFAIESQIGNSELHSGVLGNYDGDSMSFGVVWSRVEDSKSDGVRRPPRKPPDSLLAAAILVPCVLTGDSYIPPVLATRPPAKPPNVFVHGGVPSFLTSDSCKMVMARRPPAKPPDVVVGLIPWWGQRDIAAWCTPCKRWKRTSHRDMEQVRGKKLDNLFPIGMGQAQTALLKGVGPCCWWLLQKKKCYMGQKEDGHCCFICVFVMLVSFQFSCYF